MLKLSRDQGSLTKIGVVSEALVTEAVPEAQTREHVEVHSSPPSYGHRTVNMSYA